MKLKTKLRQYHKRTLYYTFPFSLSVAHPHLCIDSVMMFQANKWCTEGVELLACQQIERCQAPEFAEEALRELEEFMASSDHNHLGSSRELKTMFEDVITPETKGLVQQVIFLSLPFRFFFLKTSGDMNSNRTEILVKLYYRHS